MPAALCEQIGRSGGHVRSKPAEMLESCDFPCLRSVISIKGKLTFPSRPPRLFCVSSLVEWLALFEGPVDRRSKTGQMIFWDAIGSASLSTFR